MEKLFICFEATGRGPDGYYGKRTLTHIGIFALGCFFRGGGRVGMDGISFSPLRPASLLHAAREVLNLHTGKNQRPSEYRTERLEIANHGILFTTRTNLLAFGQGTQQERIGGWPIQALFWLEWRKELQKRCRIHAIFTLAPANSALAQGKPPNGLQFI